MQPDVMPRVLQQAVPAQSLCAEFGPEVRARAQGADQAPTMAATRLPEIRPSSDAAEQLTWLPRRARVPAFGRLPAGSLTDVHHRRIRRLLWSGFRSRG